MRYAEHLLEVAYRELQELDDNDPASVASVVLNALIDLFEDASNGYITLTGLPVAIRQGIEHERLMTPPQKQLVGSDETRERERQAIYRRYVVMIEEHLASSEVSG
jgi:hypothetical protein